MRDFNPRLHPTSSPESHGSIPAADMRALDRRHELDQEQRAFGSSASQPLRSRARPPA